MIETKMQVERALLVGVVHRFQTSEEVEHNLEELALLTTTAGAVVVGDIIQNRKSIDPAFYVGKGKAEDIAAQVDMLDVDLVVFDDELSPAQTKNLQKLMKKVKVIDRSNLILDIFARHARSKEAKTQVELARLQYLLPRLTRAWTHLERQKGGIGTRGGMGETQIEVDRRIIRNRISSLKSDLLRIEKQRDTRRKNRTDMFKVALVGYTNAGKSSLMNLFSDADVLVEDKLFATLDTTVRKVTIQDHEILLSDTVGFIHKLPHHLVASFKSTLQEVGSADLIIKVIDISAPQFEKHVETVNTVLLELGVKDRKSITVFNKIDRIDSPDILTGALKMNSNAMAVSVLRQINIRELETAISSERKGSYIVQSLVLNHDEQKLLAYLHRSAEVLNIVYEEDRIHVKVRARKSALDHIKKQVSQYN